MKQIIKWRLKNLFWVIRYPLRWLSVQRTARKNKKISRIYDCLKNTYEFRVEVDKEKLELVKKTLKKRRNLRIARLSKNWFKVFWFGDYSDILLLDDWFDCPKYTDIEVEIIGAETIYQVEQWNSWVILGYLYYQKPIPIKGWDTEEIERWVVGD